MESFFSVISAIDEFYWGKIGWLLVCITGIYLTIISRGGQFRALFNFKRNISDLLKESNIKGRDGIHPLKLYFASVGGMVGLGNIALISTALFIGGPGSIFWMVVASFCGMLLKYSEIYLGVKYRVQNKNNGFDGGPMYYLQKAFKTKFVAYLFAFILCLYGVEIVQFLILVDRIEHTFEIDRNIVIVALLSVVIYTALGGIKRLSNVCTLLMPIFMISYSSFAIYVIIDHSHLLGDFFRTVLSSAFSGHAAVGGFAGSTMIMAAYFGISKTVYSGDIAIGYDSIVQSETKVIDPKRQANLSIYALFTDSLICILTNTMLGVTGVWSSMNSLQPSDAVAHVLSNYMPYSDLFITLLFFFAGFTTVIAYLAAGMKCANFLKPRYGRYIYLLFALFAFVFFCNFPQNNVISIMGVLSGLLVLINITGIVKLRKDIQF